MIMPAVARLVVSGLTGGRMFGVLARRMGTVVELIRAVAFAGTEEDKGGRGGQSGGTKKKEAHRAGDYAARGKRRKWKEPDHGGVSSVGARRCDPVRAAREKKVTELLKKLLPFQPPVPKTNSKSAVPRGISHLQPPQKNPMKKDLNTLLNRVDTRLAACAAAAGASVAALPATSEADIVYSGPVSINIPSTTAGIYLNVVTGAFGTAAGTPGWDVNPWSSTSLSMFASTAINTALGGGVYVGTASPNNYFNLAMGTLISGASTFSGNGTSTAAASTPLNLNSSNNIIGFRFTNEATGAVNFGWMRISLSTTSGSQPRAIVEYAYENTGAGIGAGVIPEPTTYALLGLVAAGALGVRAWRKRKAA